MVRYGIWYGMRLWYDMIYDTWYDTKGKLTDFLTITSQDDSVKKTVELNKCKQWSQNSEMEEPTNAYSIVKNHLHCGMKFGPKLPF